MENPNFYAIPESHHHVSRLLVLMVILGLILAIWGLFAYFTKDKSQELPPVIETPKTQAASYEELMQEANRSSGEQAPSYNVSDLQKEANQSSGIKPDKIVSYEELVKEANK